METAEVTQEAAPKSPHVAGFTRTKPPGFMSIKWFHVTFNIIPIKAHSARKNSDWSDAIKSHH